MLINERPHQWTLTFGDDAYDGAANVLHLLRGTDVEVTWRSNGIEERRCGRIDSIDGGWVRFSTSAWDYHTTPFVGMADIVNIEYL